MFIIVWNEFILKDDVSMNTLKENLIPIVTDENIDKFTNDQLSIFWLADEIDVSKDINDVLTNFTESERHGVLTTLKLFSLYETHAGDEYWGTRFKKMWSQHTSEFSKMGSAFSMVELCIHAPFYNKINELLNLNTREFYLSFMEVPVFKERIKSIGKWIWDERDEISLAAFAFVEGVVLYSSFAYLKHFQSQGKNKLLNLVRGINFSLRDENIHCLASSYCYRLKAKGLSKEKLQCTEEEILKIAKTIWEHEEAIIDIIFEKGEIEGFTKESMQEFVKSRINLVLNYLNIDNLFEVGYNPISEWFYKAIQDYSYNDFFSGMGNQYHRNWDESQFEW